MCLNIQFCIGLITRILVKKETGGRFPTEKMRFQVGIKGNQTMQAPKTVQSTTLQVNVGSGMILVALHLLIQSFVRHLVIKIDRGPDILLRGREVTSWGFIKVCNKVIKEISDLYLNAFFKIT